MVVHGPQVYGYRISGGTSIEEAQGDVSVRGSVRDTGTYVAFVTGELMGSKRGCLVD
jgi:hypothetical protein